VTPPEQEGQPAGPNDGHRPSATLWAAVETLSPTQKHNVATITAWVEAYNTQAFDALATLADVNLVVDDPATGTHIVGWPAFRTMAQEVARRYPDRHITISRMLPLSDSAVAVDAAWQGTPAGGGPTEHRVEAMVFEFVGGKVAVRRIYR
jgi:predicted ester cyclase